MDQDKLISDFKEMMEMSRQNCQRVSKDADQSLADRCEWDVRFSEVNDIMGTPEYT